jgi:hypothetical protein
MAQGIGPEFKPLFSKNKQKKPTSIVKTTKR